MGALRLKRVDRGAPVRSGGLSYDPADREICIIAGWGMAQMWEDDFKVYADPVTSRFRRSEVWLWEP